MHINFTSKIPILYCVSCLSSAVVPDIPAASTTWRTQLSMRRQMQRHLLVLTAESKNPQAVAGDGTDMRWITAVYTVHFLANTHTHTHTQIMRHPLWPPHSVPEHRTGLHERIPGTSTMWHFQMWLQQLGIPLMSLLLRILSPYRSCLTLFVDPAGTQSDLQHISTQ